ncbi:MAG TPA: hypothetical protein VKD72_05360 [Gemmataceae bacterium]|nr:hypothetical protein [Gemmataceae bacterium]
MSRWTQILAALPLTVALFARPAQAQEEAAVLRDLTAVITLQGQPCGQVVSVTKQGDNDYVASCQDGNRYHVFIKDGRVVVQKQ